MAAITALGAAGAESNLSYAFRLNRGDRKDETYWFDWRRLVCLFVRCNQASVCARLAEQAGPDRRAVRPWGSCRHAGAPRRRPTVDRVQAAVLCRESRRR